MTDELLIDIGGTAVKYGVVNGDRMQTGSFPVCDADGVERMPERLTGLVRRTAPRRIGVSAPGPFDFATGTAYMKQKLLSLQGVSLMEAFRAAAPTADIIFVHDGVSCLLGLMEVYPALRQGTHCAVMLGTGLGYICARNGRMLVDARETPAGKLWNRPYRDRTGEYYVSATALLRLAKENGYAFDGIKAMAAEARNGNNVLRRIFRDVGHDLGCLLNERQPLDGFEDVVIGGQVSQAFDLMKDGFEEKCPFPYTVPDSPTRYPLLGLRAALRLGKDALFMREHD